MNMHKTEIGQRMKIGQRMRTALLIAGMLAGTAALGVGFGYMERVQFDEPAQAIMTETGHPELAEHATLQYVGDSSSLGALDDFLVMSEGEFYLEKGGTLYEVTGLDRGVGCGNAPFTCVQTYSVGEDTRLAPLAETQR